MKTNAKVFAFLLLALAAVRLMVMATTSVFETSESRYAAISQNMAEYNDFVVPRYIYKGKMVTFDGKPPLYFQCAGLTCKLLPWNEGLAVRLPAFLSGVGIVALLFYVVCRLRDRETAWYAAAVCATSPAFCLGAGICMTDIMLTLAVSGALLCWLLFDQTEEKKFSVAACAFLGIGMLTKGPVALVLFGLPVLTYTILFHRFSLLRKVGWLPGISVFLLIASPWYIIMTLRRPGFLEYFFLHENFLRFVTHDYGDKFGAGREFFRGMALVWMLVAALPWCLVAFFSCRGQKVREIIRAPEVAFPLLCMTCVTGFWCLTSRIPFQYILPVLPMAALAFSLLPRTRLSDISVRVMAFSLMVVMPLISPLAERTCDKMPMKLFQNVRRMVSSTANLTVAGKWPYAAEFYLGDKVTSTNDPSSFSYVLSRDRDAHRYGKKRCVMTKSCGWTLFTPQLIY